MNEQAEKELLQRVFAHIPGGRLLDVATGQGGFAGLLFDNLASVKEIIGIDSVSEKVLDMARQNFTERPQVRFEIMNACELAFEDSSFDTVAIGFSLHHLQDIPQVLTEMLRVVKPGGVFILSEMYQPGQTEQQRNGISFHHWAAAIDSACDINHDQTFTRPEVTAIVESIGLVDLNLQDWVNLKENLVNDDVRREYQTAFDRQTARVAALPEKDHLLTQGVEIIERIFAVGTQMPPVLLAVGGKG